MSPIRKMLGLLFIDLSAWIKALHQGLGDPATPSMGKLQESFSENKCIGSINCAVMTFAINHQN